MKASADVVIVGAGIVGLTVANLLSTIDGLKIILIDAGKKTLFAGDSDVNLRVSALSPGSSEVLGSTGAWDEIAANRHCPYRAMRVWDSDGHFEGPETLVFEAAEFALPQLGYIVENVLVQHALQERLSNSALDLRYDSPIRQIAGDRERYRLELASGEVLRPDLLIGADGARSFVRSSANIPVRLWPHEQSAFVTHLRPENPHQYTAWQRFSSAGPLGLLPLSDGRVSCVWSTSKVRADEALEMTADLLADTLTDESDSVLGRLSPDGPRGAFPLGSQHAEQYVLPGLALVGDAAHAIHPLAGQGVNLGIADATVLADVIATELARGENIGDLPVLRKYERARRGTNQLMLSFVDGLNRLFTSDDPALARLRGAGMLAFNRSGPLREQAVRVALGMR